MLQDAILDIAWSPTHATVFGSVTRDGWIHIWDLRVSQITPVIEIQRVRPISSILFSATSPVRTLRLESMRLMNVGCNGRRFNRFGMGV